MNDNDLNVFQDVYDFHRFYGANIGQKPGIPSEERVALRRSLVAEEMSELWKAVHVRDMVKVADGIADLIYVLIGTGLEFGLSPDTMANVWRMVQHANMMKGQRTHHEMDCALPASPLDNPARCTCGTVLYREDGKVLKGPFFQAPDEKIKVLLKDRGYVPADEAGIAKPYDHTVTVQKP